MTLLLVITYLLLGAAGAAVALTRRLADQALLLSFFGLLLTVLFVLLRAPDVALSELAVGTAAIPVMLLVAIGKVPKKHR